MNEAFDVNEYWLERGRNYVRESLPHQFHKLQEKFLIDVLRTSRIPTTRILEIGCGFGRITRLLTEAFPEAKITALDLSPEQLENAERHCGHHPNVSFYQYDFYSSETLPGAGYDAVLAIEVFLHHPRKIVRSLFDKLSVVARHLINIDWSEEWPWKTAEHVWVHDYLVLYKEAGLQCATFVLPEKVDGMQQKLFIAAKILSPVLLSAEQAARGAELLAKSPNAGSGMTVGTPPTESARWAQQLDVAIQDIRQTLPAGATFILVNDDQWGNEPRALRGYKVLPFLERDGQYWGPPADDATALAELERLRRAGATHVVFAWPSFWWLGHYSGLQQKLRASGEPILENEHVKIFRL